MTLRISTVGGPTMPYLSDVAHAYEATLAHGERVGLTASATRRLIGNQLVHDAAGARTTDWALLCDRLTGIARRRRAAVSSGDGA